MENMEEANGSLGNQTRKTLSPGTLIVVKQGRHVQRNRELSLVSDHSLTCPKDMETKGSSFGTHDKKQNFVRRLIRFGQVSSLFRQLFYRRTGDWLGNG